MRKQRTLVGLPLIAALLGLALFMAAPQRVAASATPNVSVSGYPGPGDIVTVNGGNWPYNDPISVTYDGTVVATTNARLMLAIAGSTLAAFRVSFQVPTTTTTGAHTITATDTNTNVSAQVGITVSAEWKQFGFTPAGARYNPYETAISAANVNTLALAWTFNTGYTGSVSPTIADGRLVISNGAADEQYSLNPTTGALIWSQVNNGGYDQPIVDNGIIFSSHYTLQALSLKSGALLWQSPYLAVGNNPVLANGLVYAQATVNGAFSIQAYSASGCGQARCNALWTYSPPGGYAGVGAIANGSAYLGTSELDVIDATTGAPQWSAAITTGESITGIAVDSGSVFVVGYSPYTGGTLYVFNAAGCGAATCTPAWTVHNTKSWGYSPAVANGQVYLGGRDGELYDFAEAGCGASTCSPAWKAAVPGEELSPPAVANGVVYVTSWYPGALMAFNAAGCGAATCSALWTYTPSAAPHYLDAPPTVANGMLYISDDSGFLYAFHLSATATTTATALTLRALGPLGRLLRYQAALARDAN